MRRICAALACLLCAPAAARAQELRRSGFVGVSVRAIPEAVRADLDIPEGVGVSVEGVIGGASAAAAGLRPNDVITQIGDHTVRGVTDFVDTVRPLRAGDVRALLVRRGRESLTIPITVQPRPFEAAPDVDVRYDTVTVDGSLRRTIVTMPRQPGRLPAVLFISGIGCTSQESLDLSSNETKLLYGLTRAGFVTMRVEKSGMGDSEGAACDSPAADFHAEVRAYLAGLRALKRYAFVDSDAVFLVGLSIGGVEAPLVATAEPVRGLVVVNTVAKPLFEYLLETRRRQLLLAHTMYDEIDRRMLLDERCNHQLLIARQTPEAITAAAPECADHIAYPAPFTFMQQWAEVNVAAAWKTVDCRVLILYGSSDFVSTIADDAYLEQVINGFHPGRASLQEIRGMDHAMNRAASMEESFSRTTPGVFDPAVLEATTAWLRRAIG
jgi:pimeloyl-ACP methyl ester carboxylesterase